MVGIVEGKISQEVVITTKSAEELVAELRGETGASFHLPILHVSGPDGYIHYEVFSGLDAQEPIPNEPKSGKGKSRLRLQRLRLFLNPSFRLQRAP